MKIMNCMLCVFATIEKKKKEKEKSSAALHVQGTQLMPAACGQEAPCSLQSRPRVFPADFSCGVGTVGGSGPPYGLCGVCDFRGSREIPKRRLFLESHLPRAVCLLDKSQMSLGHTDFESQLGGWPPTATGFQRLTTGLLQAAATDIGGALCS